MTQNPSLVSIDPELIKRYDKNGPRQTSYPTADRFAEAFTAGTYRFWLENRNVGRVQWPLSVYVHLPFCQSICYYCACNKIITKDYGRSAKYIKYLAREMDLVDKDLDGSRDICQLHWAAERRPS